MKWSNPLLTAASAAAILFSSCASNNVTVDDSLGHYFDSAGVKGDFALLDNGQGRFTIYNLSRYRDSLCSSGATFDIVQSLIALETGVLRDEKQVATVEDTSVADPVTPGMHIDQKTTVPYDWAMRDPGPLGDLVFRQLADSIGIDTLKKWVDSLRYGNKDIRADSGHVLIGGIKITADEQLGLTKKLYFNQLPFFRRTQELVKRMMKEEANSNYKLVYKTARIGYPDHTMGWVMGWVEENKHPYFFVLNIVAPNPNADITTTGLQLVKRILASQGFFEGKK